MCLGIPGRVVETYREHDVLMGRIDFGGVAKRVCLEHVPEAAPGDYVLVHVGFALSRLDEAEAKRVFETLRELSQLEDLEPEQHESLQMEPENPPGGTSPGRAEPGERRGRLVESDFLPGQRLDTPRNGE